MVFVTERTTRGGSSVSKFAGSCFRNTLVIARTGFCFFWRFRESSNSCGSIQARQRKTCREEDGQSPTTWTCISLPSKNHHLFMATSARKTLDHPDCKAARENLVELADMLAFNAHLKASSSLPADTDLSESEQKQLQDQVSSHFTPVGAPILVSPTDHRSMIC
jgi:hypothetical protein